MADYPIRAGWQDPIPFGLNLEQDESGDVAEMEDSPPLPPYLLAGGLGSPSPNFEFESSLHAPAHDDDDTNLMDGDAKERKNTVVVIKEEPMDESSSLATPAAPPEPRRRRVKSERGDIKPVPEKVRSRGGSLRGSAGDLSTAGLSDGRNTPKAVRRKSNRVPTRPLIERQKRTSDDENDDGASNISETPTDGTDGSATDGSSYNALVAHRLSGDTVGLPALPKIPAVPFGDHSKRQRRDVSMSAPAVAARELRLKKKQKEEQLISECMELKLEAEAIDKQTREARTQLDKLREDAMYLRSLVKSQMSTVALLEYLHKAPFFARHENGTGNQSYNLDARSMIRQISGGDETDSLASEELKTIEVSKDKEIGGICLHINGSNITLHLCSHCSSEAGSK